MKGLPPGPRTFVLGALLVWPRPLEAIGDYLDVELVVRCRCGRGMETRLGALAEQHKVPPSTAMLHLLLRIRCTGCGRGYPPPLGYEPPGPQPPPQAVFEFSELRMNPFPKPRAPPRSPRRKA